jgi:hypothetical protein
MYGIGYIAGYSYKWIEWLLVFPIPAKDDKFILINL